MKFYIEERAGIQVRVDESGGCEPATESEVVMWNENSKLKHEKDVLTRCLKQAQDAAMEQLERADSGWDMADTFRIQLNNLIDENESLTQSLKGLKKACETDMSFAARVGMMSALIDRALNASDESKEKL